MSAPADKPRHVFLIDGSGFLFRAFHALPPMTRPDGTPVNAVYGFTSMIMKLVDETDADHIAVIFDAGRRTFRNDIYPDYKANRPPPPDELIPQFDLVREATRAANIACVDMAGYEADDLIATYARLAVEAGAKVTIVSSDKDLMQLVGERVRMKDPMKNRDIGPAEVEERFGVGPDKVIDVQALAGDSTDNVPGVAGIGVKTAALLINEYGDLEAVLARAEEIKQPKRRQSLIDHADAARMSLDLVRLKDDVPVDEMLEAFAVREPEPDTLLGFLKAQNFKSLTAKFESRFGAAPTDDTGAPTATTETKVDRAYELVVTRQALEGWVEAARQDGTVAVDTETTSKHSMRARLVGVSLSLDDGRACYVPLAHKASGGQGSLDLGESDGADEDAPAQIPFEDAVTVLKPLLEDPSVLKVGQNIKYDMQVLVRHGIQIAPVDDTMVLSYVLDGGLHNHNMDELARLHLGVETIKFKDVAGTGKKQVTFDYVALDKALEYAAEDADVTGRLYRTLKPRLAGEHMVTVYETLERPLIPVLERMERHGIGVDAAALKALSQDFAARLTDLGEEIHTLARRDFNIASPKQLGEILFDEMALGGGKKTKTGAYATGADVLEDLAAQGHDLPARVLDWRQLAKLKSTYADALVEQIDPETGRLHTSYAMAV
ncbi:MAG: DNA polymerase, partial [Rhodospirillales bacterium]|nr:DNA polymerase [Rhodospirillales bacterium]